MIIGKLVNTNRLRTTIMGLLLLFAFNNAFPQCDSALVRFLNEKYDVVFSNNNRMVIFKNGEEKFRDMFEAIRQAKSTVHLEYFNFRNDSVSACLFDLLAEKVKQGVKVRALFDGFGNSSNNRPLKEHHLKKLRERGIEIYEFDKVKFPWVNHVFSRDHRKIVVVDGMTAYTGGMNVADYYVVGKPEFGDWRDIHVRIEGEVVNDLQKIFVGFWNKVTKQQVSGDTLFLADEGLKREFHNLKQDTCSSAGRKIIGVVDRVPNKTPKIIRQTFVKCIDNAEKQIQVINPYFTLNRKIRRAFRRALKRGIDVQIMVSATSDIPVTPRAVEHEVHRLMKKGAKVYMYTGGFHHSKIMMVDSCMSFVGSANLNSRSLSWDYECNLLIADRPTTLAFQQIFEEDKQTRCFVLDEKAWKSFSKSRRFQCWIYQFLTPFL